MNQRTRTGLEILFSAILLGVFGNLMLRQTPWGLNATLFVTAFVGVMAAIAWRHRRELFTVRTVALQAAMVFFASMYLIRDSVELRVYDTIAIIVLMGVLVLPNFGINQRFAGIFHYAAGFIWSGLNSLFAPFVLLGADIDWKSMPGNRLSKGVFSVLRGLAIALPLLLLFGALFMAADAAYENFANRVINFDLETVMSHVFLTSLFAWLSAGYFRSTLIEQFAKAAPAVVSPIPKAEEAKQETKPDPEAKVADDGASFVDKFTAEPAEDTPFAKNANVVEHINTSDAPHRSEQAKVEGEGSEQAPAEPKKRDWQNWDNTKFPSVFTLGAVETVLILGLLDVLFLSFVIFQLPYLFGGMEFVQNTPDLKLADFARRGFGELVAVSFLALPLLLASHWLLRRDNSKNETLFRVLAGVQIGLLFVIMASAMQRLVLLTGDLGYGWTTVRFYPMVFMIWLAVVFVWFGWTVLRGHRNNFAWGALWSAIIMLAATNLMNPDDFIARKNIQLMQQGRDFDAYYNARLSDDAIPALLEGLPAMSIEDQCAVKSTLHNRYGELGQMTDLRSFSFSNHTAFDLLRENDPVLHQTTDCRPYEQNDGFGY
ncbi:MAG: DUF4173 domain-containing protein [Chloracidobacterium sp.]|nr:DUF4173 domain-containing protein [Chloracidobacterium sp.]